ncbi:Flp family type IVb pilin [Caulobacter sp.]|uniref:Flp family type IVb pilin n=1 Tax=Caulobacter sp. TaxID=78 RepID=UPI003BAB7DBB
MVARSALTRFWRDERGATAIEVGVLVALICVAIISAISTLSGAIKVSFGKASTAMASTTGT